MLAQLIKQILIVDDHELVRRGIRSVLLEDSRVFVCGEAINGLDAVAKAKELKPDVIIMDITMPVMDGIEATRQIRRCLPLTSVIIVSQHDSGEVRRVAFEAGAVAYIAKTAIGRDLLIAVEKTFAHSKKDFDAGDAK